MHIRTHIHPTHAHTLTHARTLICVFVCVCPCVHVYKVISLRCHYVSERLHKSSTKLSEIIGIFPLFSFVFVFVLFCTSQWHTCRHSGHSSPARRHTHDGVKGEKRPYISPYPATATLIDRIGPKRAISPAEVTTHYHTITSIFILARKLPSTPLTT